MERTSEYAKNLQILRSMLIVDSLKKRKDINAKEKIKRFRRKLVWKPLNKFMIERKIWQYVQKKSYNPNLVFCHPDILCHEPSTSLYYRGLCGLSIKAVKGYVGDIKQLEDGIQQMDLKEDKALKMAQTYNTFICSIIKNSAEWTLENGHRTIIATLGITLDGIMRNKIGHLAETRVRNLILEWLIENKLLLDPRLQIEDIQEDVAEHNEYKLKNEIIMKFGSEPDISFLKRTKSRDVLIAVVEIKGGTDPAGALERYGAATKSFKHAIEKNPQCKNIFLSAIYTDELERRIQDDRLVDKHFDIVRMLENLSIRKDFFEELFHYILRLI